MKTSKRVVDIGASLVALVVAAPIIVAAAVVIRLREGGPVLYSSSRVGEAGVPFRLLKLRTMVPGAASHRLGSVTVADDPRVTPTGRFLRRYKLDELPQLVNVLAGQMSLVGPRPECPEFVSAYTDEQRQVLRYRPGITSPASIVYLDEAGRLAAESDAVRVYREQILPDELRIDLDYMEQATVRSDLRVVARTVAALVTSRGDRDG